MISRYIWAWIPMIFIGIINGMLRETTYGKHLSELRAHQLSTTIGILLFGFYIALLTHFWSFESSEQALAIGLIWFALTIIFEFTFGRYVVGQTWDEFLGDYNIFAGRLWIIVLVWFTIAPSLFYHVFK